MDLCRNYLWPSIWRLLCARRKLQNVCATVSHIPSRSWRFRAETEADGSPAASVCMCLSVRVMSKMMCVHSLICLIAQIEIAVNLMIWGAFQVSFVTSQTARQPILVQCSVYTRVETTEHTLLIWSECSNCFVYRNIRHTLQNLKSMLS